MINLLLGLVRKYLICIIATLVSKSNSAPHQINSLYLGLKNYFQVLASLVHLQITNLQLLFFVWRQERVLRYFSHWKFFPYIKKSLFPSFFFTWSYFLFFSQKGFQIFSSTPFGIIICFSLGNSNFQEHFFEVLKKRLSYRT